MRYMLPKISIYIKERNTVYLCYVNDVKFFVFACYETTCFQFYYYHRNSILYRYSFDYITLRWISEFYTFLKNIGFLFSFSFFFLFFLYIHDQQKNFLLQFRMGHRENDKNTWLDREERGKETDRDIFTINKGTTKIEFFFA